MNLNDLHKGLASEILGPKAESSKPVEPLKVIAQELIEAIHARNADDVVAALKAAFTECEAGPQFENDEG